MANFLDSILILPVVLIKEQLQKPQMKAKVVKERKKIKKLAANFSKGNSLIAMFSNISHGVKNPFTARMLSYEVLNLVK